MKKRFIAALSALALVLALPVAAFAANSPSEVSDTRADSNGVVATVKATATGDNAWVKVEGATAAASNVPAGANVVASFVVTEHNTTGPYTFSFNLGKQYAGAKVTVYIQHDEGEPEVKTVTADANGVVSFTMDKLCTISLVAEPTNGSVTADKGAKSPATGVNTAAAAGVAAVAVAGAACAFVALRKNN